MLLRHNKNISLKRSSLENYTSNNTHNKRKRDTTQDNTMQHDTTQAQEDKASTTRLNTSATRNNTSTTRV